MSEKSKCPNCKNTEFEMHVENVKEKEQIHFVRCSKCLTAIGVVDRVIPSINLSVLDKKLNEILFKLKS